MTSVPASSTNSLSVKRSRFLRTLTMCMLPLCSHWLNKSETYLLLRSRMRHQRPKCSILSKLRWRRTTWRTPSQRPRSMPARRCSMQETAALDGGRGEAYRSCAGSLKIALTHSHHIHSSSFHLHLDTNSSHNRLDGEAIWKLCH